MCAELVYPCEVNDRSNKASKKSWSWLNVGGNTQVTFSNQCGSLACLFLKNRSCMKLVKALTLIKDIPQQHVFLSN